MEDDQTKTLGKRFFFVAWIFVFFILYLFFDQKLNNRYNPNQNPQSLRSDSSIEVILERNVYNAYVVTGSINNEPVNFTVDTGATLVAVPSHMADRLGLQQGASFQTITANGTAIAYQTQIDKLQFGDIVLYDVQASISPGIRDPIVLLGMSALKKLEFTQRGDTLTIRQYL
ncbi:MAG: TIGR02281 family clan AA aspartic protease [Pseudomonadota bacterium]